MALHDFWCRRCGQVLVDVNVPISVGATAGAPLHCGEPTAWIPQVGRMDAYEPFEEFTTFDGRNQPVLVDSLSKLRKVEREAEAAARNGEGQPMVWRRYSNDSSNRDVHTLAPGWQGGEAPSRDFVEKHGAAIRRTVDEPDLDYGPGVSDATPSALDALNKQ